MTYVVGYSPHKDDACALSLAAQFARSDKDSVHAVTVVPQGWEVAAGSATDGDFTAWAQGQGEASAEEALTLLGADAGVPIAASWVTGRSVPAALLEQVEALDADMIVVGSGANGAPGRVAMTAKTDRLLHSSPVPVAIAPRGYAAEPRSVHPAPSGSATTTPRGTCSSGWRTSSSHRCLAAAGDRRPRPTPDVYGRGQWGRGPRAGTVASSGLGRPGRSRRAPGGRRLRPGRSGDGAGHGCHVGGGARQPRVAFRGRARRGVLLHTPVDAGLPRSPARPRSCAPRLFPSSSVP